MSSEKSEKEIPWARQQVDPISPEKLLFAMNVSNAAAELKMPVESPTNMGVNIVDGANIDEIRFTDTAMNRAIFAIKKEFPEDFSAIVVRIMAMMDAADTPIGRKWLKENKEDDGGVLVSTAVIAAAAEFPMRNKDHMKTAAFWELVQKLDDADVKIEGAISVEDKEGE